MADLNPVPAPAVPVAEIEGAPIFSGPVSLWMGFRTFLMIVLLELAGLAALIYGSIYASPSLRNPALIGGAALMLATSFMFLYVLIRVRSHRYKITAKLVERESGVIVRHVDSLDLARVKDVELTQSLFDRMLNIGTIELISADRLNPDMRIEAIPNPRPIYQQLRDAVIALNQRRGIVTPEQ